MSSAVALRCLATLEDPATMSGVPLYVAYGFRRVEDVEVPLPDGVVLEGVAMELSLA